MLKASDKKFDGTNCEYERTRDLSGGMVCERSVSTCRTAENKDRSRERVGPRLSREGERRKEGRKEGTEEGGRERLAGCLTEATTATTTAGCSGDGGGC